jgi:hypothetical protein
MRFKLAGFRDAEAGARRPGVAERPGHQRALIGLVIMRASTSLTSPPHSRSGPVALHNRALRIISERPDHLHDHPTCRRRGVDGFGQAAEAGSVPLL